jgi:hypothetical protein
VDKREAAGVLAQTKWLKDQIKGWEAAAKDVLMGELQAGERATATAPDGAKLGYVTKANGKRTMQIDNEDGFLAWVQMRYPSEIVQSIRPAFVKKLQERALDKGALIDAKGEVCPHVSIVYGDEYTFVTLDKLADILITQSIQQRKLMDVITPPSELPAGTINPDDVISDRTVYACPDCGAEVDQPHADNCHAWMLMREGAVYEAQLWERGEMQDTTTAYTQVAQNAPVDPEPDLSDEQVGPPNWGDSNTFEADLNVQRKRGNPE